MAQTVAIKRWVVFVPRGELFDKVPIFIKEMQMCGRSQSFYIPEPT